MTLPFLEDLLQAPRDATALVRQGVPIGQQREAPSHLSQVLREPWADSLKTALGVNPPIHTGNLQPGVGGMWSHSAKDITLAPESQREELAGWPILRSQAEATLAHELAHASDPQAKGLTAMRSLQSLNPSLNPEQYAEAVKRGWAQWSGRSDPIAAQNPELNGMAIPQQQVDLAANELARLFQSTGKGKK